MKHAHFNLIFYSLKLFLSENRVGMKLQNSIYMMYSYYTSIKSRFINFFFKIFLTQNLINYHSLYLNKSHNFYAKICILRDDKIDKK